METPGKDEWSCGEQLSRLCLDGRRIADGQRDWWHVYGNWTRCEVLDVGFSARLIGL